MGMIGFNSELRRNMRNLIREIGGKGSLSLCGGHALARIGRAHTIFGRQKLPKRRKRHNKLLIHEMHYMS
jgi:hypothetical protein